MIDDDTRDDIDILIGRYSAAMSIQSPTFEFSPRMFATAARCYYPTPRYPNGKIVFSSAFIERNARNRETLRWTVVHECAHLATPPRQENGRFNYHSRAMKDICRRHGVDPDGYPLGTIPIVPRYTLICTECSRIVRRYHRQQQRERLKECPSCGCVRRCRPGNMARWDDA